MTLRDALQKIASQCDGARERNGVGFSTFDAPMAHILLAMPTWSVAQEYTAHRLLRKYKTQLKELGIDYDTLPVPILPKTPEAPKIVVASVMGKPRLALQFSYNKELIEKVKGLRAVFFRRDDKLWIAADRTRETAAKLLEFGLANGFEISEPAQAHIATWEEDRSDEVTVSLPFAERLRPFQLEAVEWALRLREKRILIADQMGLGKTIEAIAILEALNAYPALIVPPASLKLNWQRELQTWVPNRTTTLINSGNVTVPTTVDVVICNYDLLGDKEEVLSACGKQLKLIAFRALIVDESHYVKEPKALRTKAVAELAKNIPTRILLTGTPVLNRPKELISQLKILGRFEEFGGWKTFVYRYCGAFRQKFGRREFLNIDGAKNLDELNARLRATCMIRRTKDEVLAELPAKQRTRMPVEITNRAEYQQAEQRLIEWVKERARQNVAFLESIKHLDEEERLDAIDEYAESKARKAEKAEAMVKIEALKQVSARGKLAATMQWIEDFMENREKLIVFCHHRDIQETLYRWAEQKGYKPAKIEGNQSTEERQVQVDRFQADPTCRIIVSSLQAGGVGITLTAASDVLFVELGWTPALMEQAEDRAHRISQQNQVNIYYLLGSQTIDEMIDYLIERKRQVVNAATDGQAATKSGSILPELIQGLLAK